MQCITRFIEHLPLTHLEIVTLAYERENFWERKSFGGVGRCVDNESRIYTNCMYESR